MKGVLKKNIFHSKNNLKEGKIVKIFMAEHPRSHDPEDGWYLIELEGEKCNYVSDREVENGTVIRTYRDPELKEYHHLPYIWINKRDVQIIRENNRDAKMLLKKHEWSV